MNILLMGFSTTGKSTLLEEIKKEITEDVLLLDSDKIISKEYEEHIYRLFLEKYDSEDPVNRRNAMDGIDYSENKFIIDLNRIQNTYIAALGPNVHTRSGWKAYYSTAKPYVIFLKADVDLVYNGLIRREAKLPENFKNNKAFGIWNHGVTRQYNFQTKKYEDLSEKVAKNNIAALIKINEIEYAKIANSTFDASLFFDWHPNYDENAKRRFIDQVRKCISL